MCSGRHCFDSKNQDLHGHWNGVEIPIFMHDIALQMGIEPTTSRLTVSRSAYWATRESSDYYHSCTSPKTVIPKLLTIAPFLVLSVCASENLFFSVLSSDALKNVPWKASWSPQLTLWLLRYTSFPFSCLFSNIRLKGGLGKRYWKCSTTWIWIFRSENSQAIDGYETYCHKIVWR